MDSTAQNKGSFDVINALGKAGKVRATPLKPQKTKPDSEDEWLEEMQQLYLWEHTFEVI